MLALSQFTFFGSFVKGKSYFNAGTAAGSSVTGFI
jgi:hypothetical protein